MSEQQAKLDVTTDAPDYVCMVCGTEGQWKDALWTELKQAQCPKCKENGLLAIIEEVKDLDEYFKLRPGLKERMIAKRKELGISTTGKVKLP